MSLLNKGKHTHTHRYTYTLSMRIRTFTFWFTSENGGWYTLISLSVDELNDLSLQDNEVKLATT